MLQRVNLWWLLATILVIRLVAMYYIPLMDTTEARYGAIAQLMVTTHDWITPWFKPDVVFWGKPPLSFWAQALSFKWFGISELSARLPAFLVTLATLGLLYLMATEWFNRRVATLSVLIYASSALVFVCAGAVITDTFLTLGTTWALTGFAMTHTRQHGYWYWRYGLFIGTAIGLLAKGPITLVLVGGPILVWLLVSPQARNHCRSLPWLKGSLLTALIALPWYIAAELKTPGFLEYFIWGEHVRRFIDPGWAGDLYGHAHLQPKGMIWLLWLGTTLPWSPIALYFLVRQLYSNRASVVTAMRDEKTVYLLAWVLITPLFFTVASNILWTYLLPAIAPFCLLLAVRIESMATESKLRIAYVPALITPLLILVGTILFMNDSNMVKSERDLIRFAYQQNAELPLLFLNEPPPFSARFYSNEQVATITSYQLPDYMTANPNIWLVVNTHWFNQIPVHPGLQIEQQFASMRYILARASLDSDQNPDTPPTP